MEPKRAPKSEKKKSWRFWRSSKGGDGEEVSECASQMSTLTVSRETGNTGASPSSTSVKKKAASSSSAGTEGVDEFYTSLGSLVVVPLPRRPLFPGFYTAAYMKNQPKLRSSLAEGSNVAALMLNDAADYRGCIVREGLEGKRLLSRLHSVGTLATVCGIDEETGRVELIGQRRIRVVDVVSENPLTVRTEMLEEINLELQKLTPAQIDAADNALTAIGKLRPARLSKDSAIEQYFENRSWHSGFIADFGPATMPVYDRELHQAALEELDGGKRLELTVGILKREVDMDDTNIWVPLKPDDEYTEEEKEVLADLRVPGEKSTLEMDQMFVFTGEVLIAPSVQMRVRLDELRILNGLRPADSVKKLKECHSITRIGEHYWGY